MFAISEEKEGPIDTNLEKLVSYYDSKGPKKNDRVWDIIFRFYDHTHLAFTQKGTMIREAESRLAHLQEKTDDLKKQLSKAQQETDNLKEQISKAQQNYITALGLFITILLAAGGVLSATNAVFSNILIGNIPRIICASFIVAILVFNLLFFMASFISKVSGLPDSVLSQWWESYNKSLVCGCLFILIVYGVMHHLKWI